MKLRTLTSNAFFVGARVAQWLQTGLTAAATGICHNPEVTTQAQKKIWDRWQSFLEPEFVFSGLMEWEKKVYKDHLSTRGKIGVIGCGAGRDLMALAAQKYHVEGLDLSPKAVELAHKYLAEKNLKAKVFCGDASDFEFPDKLYSTFIFSWFTYSYVPGVERRTALLSKLGKKLHPKGNMIISYIKVNRAEDERFIRIARFFARLTGNPFLPVSGDHFDSDLQYAHCFTPEEIALEAGQAGFSVTHYPDAEVGIAVLTRAT